MRKIKKPKSLRQQLIKANDDLFRELIRDRDKVCQVTYRPGGQVAHYWSRELLRTRWLMNNACLLNGQKHIFWAHARPDQFKEFWIKRIGQAEFDKLELIARYAGQVKTDFLLATNYTLKQQVKAL